jgi:hypothetical protein
MFHQRSSTFSRNAAALEGRLRALENKVGQLSEKAGRYASGGLSTAGDHLGDAIAGAVNETLDRLRDGGQLPGREAMRLGSDAAKFGARVGTGGLQRMASATERHPMVALAIAAGVGILIGMASGIARGRD